MDYELLTDDKGFRLVKFGTFAGYAGMIDTLCGLGQRLLGLGQSSPFLVKQTVKSKHQTGLLTTSPFPFGTHRTLACRTPILH